MLLIILRLVLSVFVLKWLRCTLLTWLLLWMIILFKKTNKQKKQKTKTRVCSVDRPCYYAHIGVRCGNTVIIIVVFILRRCCWTTLEFFFFFLLLLLRMKCCELKCRTTTYSGGFGVFSLPIYCKQILVKMWKIKEKQNSLFFNIRPGFSCRGHDLKRMPYRQQIPSLLRNWKLKAETDPQGGF